MFTSISQLPADRLHHVTSRARAGEIATILKGAKIDYQMKPMIGDPDGGDCVISVPLSDEAACFAFRAAVDLDDR